MGRLGHERARFVHRSEACRLDEFCKLQGRDARAVPFRRSLGDTAGGRTAVFGIYLDRAGNPEHHASGRRREQDRTFWFLSPRTSRHSLARRGGVARGDGLGRIRPSPLQKWSFEKSAPWPFTRSALLFFTLIRQTLV